MQTISHSTVSSAETQQREARLIEAARAGDTAGLVEYIYVEKLRARAANLARGFHQAYGAHLDPDDIAQEGAVYVLRGLGKALCEATSPIGWLLCGAQRYMLHYCGESRSLVRVPYSSQYSGAAVPWVGSLDAPIPGTDGLVLGDLVAAEVRP